MLTSLAPAAYALGQVLLASGLSCAALAMPRSLPLPDWGRAAFGIASTPFVTASLVLGLTLVAPGLSSTLLALAPAMFGIFLIMCCWQRLRRTHAQIWPIDWRDPLLWAVLASVAVLLFVIAPRLWFYAHQPTGNSDGMQYLAQARHLLSHRSFFAIAGIDGLADASLRGDAHGALWIGYNASALATSSLLGTGPFDESAARLGFQATFLAYLCSGVALASSVRLRGMAALTVFMIVTVPQLPSISIGGDRDGFRLAALLLLCAFLMAHAQDRLRNAGFAAILLAGVLGCWALQSHGLSLVLVPLIVAPWLLLSLACGQPALKAVTLAGAVTCGFGLGALHVATAYMKTGSLTGDNVDAAKVLTGTVYTQGYAARETARIGEGSVLASRLRISFARDSGWPSGAAFAIVAIAAFASFRKRTPRNEDEAVGMAGTLLVAWFLSQSLLLLGAFDVGLYKLSDWTVLNARYAMQWYLFAALVVAWGVAAGAAALRRYRAQFRPVSAALLCGAMAGTALLAANRLSGSWPYYSTNGYVLLSSKLNALTDALPPACRTLSEDTGVNFYARQPVVQLYSKYLRELVQETDTEALLRKLDDRHICAVILYTGLYVDAAGPGTPLTKLLSSPAFRLQDAAPWRIYLRNRLQVAQ
jgi:hypothetical protein